MKANPRVVIFVVSLIYFSFTMKDAVMARQSFFKLSSAISYVEDQVLQPRDFFDNFPEVKLRMSFQDARTAIERGGNHPVGFRDGKSELAWDGTFGGINGRATVLFKEGTGAHEIAVIVYAMDKRKDVFNAWEKRLVNHHGAPKETQENRAHVSDVWRFSNGVVIELRLLKDDDNPVVDIHWVTK